MKRPSTDNEYNKLMNRESQIENRDITENNIKIDEMKLNIPRELIKITKLTWKTGYI